MLHPMSFRFVITVQITLYILILSAKAKSREESNPDRFSRAAFRQYCGKSLDNTKGYSLRDFSCLAKKLVLENCAAPRSMDFCFGFLCR